MHSTIREMRSAVDRMNQTRALVRFRSADAAIAHGADPHRSLHVLCVACAMTIHRGDARYRVITTHAPCHLCGAHS